MTRTPAKAVSAAAALLALTACGQSADQASMSQAPADRSQAAQDAAKAPQAEEGGALPGWPEGAGEQRPLSAEDMYRQNVAGRWSEAPNCGGMTWNFQADSLTTPGETHCAAVAVEQGMGETVRVAASQCTAEGAAQPDLAMDITTEGDRITVAGVGNAISTENWTRCE